MPLPLRFQVAGVVVLAALMPTGARADAASDAKDLFARGREMRTQGNCSGAVAFFRKAYEVYPGGLGSLRNVAECEEQLGHYASSRRAWLDLKRGLVTTDDHKYEGWALDADQAAARLAPKLATVTVDLNLVGPDGAASEPSDGVEVALDGDPLPKALIGTALERDPGQHVLRVTGKRVQDPQQRTLDLVAGDVKRIALRVVVTPDKVEPPEVVAPEATPRENTEDPGSQARATRRTIGWIAIGAGGASLIGAGVSLVVRQSALNDVNAQCHDNVCAPSLQPTVSRGDLAATLVNVLGTIGVAGVAGGILLLATSAEPAPARAGLVVTPTLGGASATWRW
jgi:hypothetical protein